MLDDLVPHKFPDYLLFRETFYLNKCILVSFVFYKVDRYADSDMKFYLSNLA